MDNIGFYANVISDAISVQSFRDRTEAHSVLEGLRKGAAQVLDMEMEDLQPLVIGQQGQDACDGILYDPMPGGSGLLEQMVERWSEVIEAALQAVEGCPSQCADACVDCLMSFRNSWYHRHLNRHVASQVLRAWGGLLVLNNDIPARQPAPEPQQMPVNEAERILREMFDRAGLNGYEPQTPIELGRPLGTTVPDFFFADPEGEEPGICVYLDGMSAHLHGNPETAERDRHIREQLRSMGYQVIEIPFGQLTDRQAMRGHFSRIGRFLLGRDNAARIREDLTWFDAPPQARTDPWDELESVVDPKWLTLISALRTAAGVPVPSDVNRDVVEGGRVTGRRMIAVWDERGSFYGILERRAQESLEGDARYLLVNADTPVDDIVRAVIAHFTDRDRPAEAGR